MKRGKYAPRLRSFSGASGPLAPFHMHGSIAQRQRGLCGMYDSIRRLLKLEGRSELKGNENGCSLRVSGQRPIAGAGRYWRLEISETGLLLNYFE